MKKRIPILLLCIAQVFVFAACNNDNPKGDSSGSTGNPAAVEFWSTAATEKVLQKKVDGVDYDGIKGAAEINMDAFRGEYESAQLIMSASSKVRAYNASVSDLNGPDGAVFSKENIEIRKEMYMEVKQVFEPNGAPKGWYPDALLPLPNAVTAGENSIAAGENQGLYITFRVPASQKAGRYTGTMTVTYDGNQKVIPVNLNVIDYAISEQTRSYSYFSIGWHQHLGELDSSREMYRNYVEFLADYRLSAGRMMHYDSFSLRSDEGIKTYVEETWDLVHNYGVPSFDIPMTHVSGMDSELLERYIIAFAEKSLEVGENLLAKAKLYGAAIDEPYAYGEVALNAVRNSETYFKAGKAEAISSILELKSKYADQSDFIDELAASAADIPLIVTTYYTEDFEEAGVETYCPKASEYDTEEQRAQYVDQKEKWWYTCVDPRTPYPTYRTEDHLVSARSLGWMMSEYNVKGNLFWALDIYGKAENDSVYMPIEDYFADSVRYPLTNGDGYLLYPGSKYGIEGPIASMRLEAIRDGNEEYELLYDLREAYESHGRSADEIQRYISNLFYFGTKVSCNSDRFFDARKAIAQLVMLAKSPAAVCISGVSDDGKGNVVCDITANEGYELKNNGAKLTAVSSADGKNDYRLEIDLSQNNAIALSVDVDGKEYRFDFDMEKVVYYGAEELLATGKFSDGTATVNAVLENGKIRLTVGETQNSYQRVRFTSEILSALGETRKKIVLHLETTEETYFSLSAKFGDATLSNNLYSGVIAAGANEIAIDLSAYPFGQYGKMEYIDINLSRDAGAHLPKVLYISGLAIYSE